MKIPGKSESPLRFVSQNGWNSALRTSIDRPKAPHLCRRELLLECRGPLVVLYPKQRRDLRIQSKYALNIFTCTAETTHRHRMHHMPQLEVDELTTVRSMSNFVM